MVTLNQNKDRTKHMYIGLLQNMHANYMNIV